MEWMRTPSDHLQRRMIWPNPIVSAPHYFLASLLKLCRSLQNYHHNTSRMLGLSHNVLNVRPVKDSGLKRFTNTYYL